VQELSTTEFETIMCNSPENQSKEVGVNQPWLRDSTTEETLFVVFDKKLKTVANSIDSFTNLKILTEISS
jgi:hypothetical protein